MIDHAARAERLVEGDDDEKLSAFVYALLAIARRLESIDDALRNTVGGGR
jgi:hypothetical protein